MLENIGGFAGKICVQVFGFVSWKKPLPCNPVNIGVGEWAQRDTDCLCSECVVESLCEIEKRFPAPLCVSVFCYN
jgi:hypothetical protein